MLRVIALALACFALGRDGYAAPSSLPASSIAAPPGWKSTPELAAAMAHAAHAASVNVTASEGWSDPALGCYAGWLRITGPALQVDRAAQQLIASVQSAGVSIRNAVAPTDRARGVVALQFSKAPYQGVLRGALTPSGELEALACAWNQREPALCAAACAKLAGAIQ